MSTTYLKRATHPRKTPQSKPIPGREADMTQNSAGGYTFVADDWSRLTRFLVIGTAGGTFYIEQAELTSDNADVVIRCLKQDGVRVVNEIVAISDAGRAPKNDFAIYALALACVPEYADEATRRAAFDAIPKVCRIGTHILMFADIVDSLRSWGGGLAKAVAAWYEQKTGQELAYQLVKYQNREGWTHKDVLRSTHKTAGSAHGDIYDWLFGAAGKPATAKDRAKGVGTVRGKRALTVKKVAALPPSIHAYEAAQKAKSSTEIVRLISEYGGALPHEVIPTNLKADGEVWLELLRQGMPIIAMVRNLANMTRYGTIRPNSEGERLVRETLANEEKLRNSRIHPFAVLTALKRYGQGGAQRQTWMSYGRSYGSTGKTFTPNQRVMDALDRAFYAAFQNVVPSDKRFVLGIDVSGSMSMLAGTPPDYDERDNRILTCSEVAAAFGMVLEATEPYVATMGFDQGMIDLEISHRQRLDQVAERICGINGGGTDCSLPMLWAAAEGVEADCFLVITDNETWFGHTHPSQALEQYRKKMGIDARLVVAAMAANKFTIADPADPGMLDIVGFDSAMPAIVSDFAAGRI